MISIFAGLITGFIVSKFVPLPHGTQEIIGKLSNLAIILLLFTMGITIGANPDVMLSLPSLGLSAFMMASATVLGSTMAVWIVKRLVKRGAEVRD